MLENLIHSTIGLLHTIAAVLAMVFGTVVLLNVKGTKFHVRIGYAYVVMMLFLNISSFFIVNFGGFSIFHFFAIVSLATIIAAMIPTLRRPKKWLVYHYYFMSWSVVGLYCAFWSEVGTRFVGNMRQFWWAVFLAILVTTFLGNKIIKKQAKKIKF